MSKQLRPHAFLRRGPFDAVRWLADTARRGDRGALGDSKRRRFTSTNRRDGVIVGETRRGRFNGASRGDGSVRAGVVGATMRGFTLIEVLLATVLLASGLALAFASLRAATGTAERGEGMAQRSERVRAVEGFLRRRITGARPIPFGADADSGQQLRFLGDERRMRFVADVPDYLGRGGPYLHELAVEDAGDSLRLTVSLTMVQSGVLLPERPPRPAEPLAEGLREVRFRYRAMDVENRPGDWQDTWEDGERLPLQVQVLLRDVDGRAWPPLVVALPLANSHAAMAGGAP